MHRRQLDDNTIETYIAECKTDAEFVPARNRFLKNLLADANKLGLSVYGRVNYLGKLVLDISIGNSIAENAPGELSLSITHNSIQIENLTINKFRVNSSTICDRPSDCSQACMKKFGWYNYSGHNYSSRPGHFDFSLSMLSNWLRKLTATADAIAETKAQLAKSRKIAEIKADRMQEILESVANSIEEKLPELKCKLRRFPEQKSFGLWLYNVEVDAASSTADNLLKCIFKPAEEYMKFSADDWIYLDVTRSELEEKQLKPVRMFTIEKCVKPSALAQRKFEYVVWFVYDEESGDWICKSPTSLPGFEKNIHLAPEQIEAWAGTLIDAEIAGYSVLKDYECRMNLLAGEKYGRWACAD